MAEIMWQTTELKNSRSTILFPKGRGNYVVQKQTQMFILSALPYLGAFMVPTTPSMILCQVASGNLSSTQILPS